MCRGTKNDITIATIVTIPEFPRLVMIRSAVDSMQRLSCEFMAKMGRLLDTSPPSPLRWLSSNSLKLAWMWWDLKRRTSITIVNLILNLQTKNTLTLILYDSSHL